MADESNDVVMQPHHPAQNFGDRHGGLNDELTQYEMADEREDGRGGNAAMVDVDLVNVWRNILSSLGACSFQPCFFPKAPSGSDVSPASLQLTVASVHAEALSMRLPSDPQRSRLTILFILKHSQVKYFSMLRQPLWSYRLRVPPSRAFPMNPHQTVTVNDEQEVALAPETTEEP